MSIDCVGNLVLTAMIFYSFVVTLESQSSLTKICALHLSLSFLWTEGLSVYSLFPLSLKLILVSLRLIIEAPERFMKLLLISQKGDYLAVLTFQ